MLKINFIILEPKPKYSKKQIKKIKLLHKTIFYEVSDLDVTEGLLACHCRLSTLSIIYEVKITT